MNNQLSIYYKSITLALVFVFLLFTANAQLYVVDYMKVKPGQWDNYLKVEEEWAKAHKKRLDAGIINAWYFNEKLFHGTNDEYDFATVNVYPNWAAYENAYSDEYMEGLDESIIEMTGDTRDIVRSEVYALRVAAENGKPSNVITIAYMKVKQENNDAYLDMERKFFKPFHEALIEAGARNSWSIYQRVVPFGTKGAGFIAVNGYESIGHLDGAEVAGGAYEDAEEKANFDELGNLINETRDLLYTVIWRSVDRVVKDN